jgi:hypothetical protein
MLRTVRKYFRARNIRSIRIMRWTEQFIPLIQEELHPYSVDSDIIEQAAYIRANSLVHLLSDLVRLHKEELAFLRVSRQLDIPDEMRERVIKMSNDLRDKRIERLFNV